ncbi:MAG: endonuclease/exonuclease/phosphatase family protein [Enterococcus sp.]
MKLMTLNTHSWLEENPKEKLHDLADRIVQEGYDAIGLQEINQRIDSLSLSELDNYFCSVKEQTAIHDDNFAYQLIRELNKRGVNYYWSWEMSHIGYSIYEEGNALLSKQPLTCNAVHVSEATSTSDYRTRVVIIGETTYGNQKIQLASCHFSWWEDEERGFAYEWQRFEEAVQKVKYPLVVLGDFNNPANQEGYQMVCESHVSIKDAYTAAKQVVGEATVEKKIDGWEENKEKLRIDYIFVPTSHDVETFQVIFDGENGPIISDHYGVEIEIALEQ